MAKWFQVPNKLLLSIQFYNENWQSYIGVPYLGAGQKLKTRRVYDQGVPKGKVMGHLSRKVPKGKAKVKLR